MTVLIRKGGCGRASRREPQRQNQSKQTLSGVSWCHTWHSRGVSLVTQPSLPGAMGFWLERLAAAAG